MEQYFHHVFLSHKIGELKPDRQIFTHTLEKLSITGDKILYCDDLPLNVSAAQDAGFDAYHTKGFQATQKIIQEKTGYPVLENSFNPK